jgi:hypothetical protein
MTMEDICELRRMIELARRLAELLPDPRAVEHLHAHGRKLEAMALELESRRRAESN